MPVVCESFDSLGFDEPGKRFRLGIMGGTFDPIHIGHLACAEQVREAFALDGVVFIPAGDPWMKRDRNVTPAHQRLAMVRCAVADNPAFDVSSVEIERPGATYTVDTLRFLRGYYPDNVELYFITGADAVLNILDWKDSDELGKLAHIVAVTRPGFDLADGRHADIFGGSCFGCLHRFEITALAISSTDLRSKVASGRSIRYLTPSPVCDYIAENGLYRIDA